MNLFSNIVKRVKAFGMPPVLYVVEIILTYVLIRNMNLFYYLEIMGWGPNWPQYTALLTIVVITTILTVRAMIGIPSSDRYSWRTTVRTLIVLIPLTVIYYVFNFGYFFIDPWLLLTIMSVSIGIMFMPSVRRYHIPPLRKVPPLKEWVKFIFIRPEETEYKYRFVYEKKDEN